ncbi:hypothetical protein [Aporhodopirellula aestuarii]|uniref:BON domain-containing protein n=1 Tax=Aporhodopirellula aestuarii TaxID=2950107 RepID=A0ABT0U818_9BACT|nr:hypothetical protein [Aporhodopirellula aestuarii]MCM2373092.1 hypothetical protein [Aporhodopirellula aestuarii]
MDRDKPRENRQCRRVSKKRIWLASLIDSNLLKLGAGVTVGIASCGLVGASALAADARPAVSSKQVSAGVVRSNPYVAPTSPSGGLFATGLSATHVAQTSDLQYSELRLKSIGTAVGLVPIGNPRSVSPTIEITKPHPSKIRVNPMAGGSPELIDQPVLALDESPENSSNHPRILSIRRNDGAPAADKIPVEMPDDAVASSAGPQWGIPHVVQTPVPAAVPEASEPEAVVLEATKPEARMPGLAAAPSSSEAATTDEPVFFSFSDLAESTDTEASESEANADQFAAESVKTPADSGGFFIPPPPKDNSRVVAQATKAKAPEDGTRSNPFAAELEPLPLLPEPSRQWVASSPSSASAQKYPNRHRRHVEVAAPPMIPIARNGKTGTVSAAPIVPARLAGFTMPKPAEAEESVMPQQTVTPVAKAPESALMREIRETHPTARVSMAEVKDKVIVRGICRTREQAIEIIRLIRSHHLVPVDDQLVIR